MPGDGFAGKAQGPLELCPLAGNVQGVLVLLASLAQPPRSFGEDINLSRHQPTSAQCHLLCYTPLVISSVSLGTTSCSLLCFALTVLLVLTSTFMLFRLTKDTMIKCSGTGGLGWNRGDAKAGPVPWHYNVMTWDCQSAHFAGLKTLPLSQNFV